MSDAPDTPFTMKNIGVGIAALVVVMLVMKDSKKSSGDGASSGPGMPTMTTPGMPNIGDATGMIPVFGAAQLRQKRDEICQNIKAIKTAQISYESMNDVYVACSAYPSTPTKTPQQWTKGASGGFATINWTPDGDVRGSYGVSTTTTNFVITGLSDVDGDGTAATYVATKSENCEAITAPDVY